jgi:glyoxylase-like metal-dependent hydrolase (beta-lactamase superfamily II)
MGNQAAAWRQAGLVDRRLGDVSEHTIKLGAVEVTGLLDHQELANPAEMFPAVTKEAWDPYRKIYPELFASQTELHWFYCCYLVRSAGRTIVVDLGIGPANGPEAKNHNATGRLMDALSSNGVRVEDVDTVVLTHLHGDHVGWSATLEGDRYKPVFSQARYIAHQADWDEFSKPGHPHIAETVEPVEAAGQLDLVSEPEVMIDSEIRLLHSPGHTPGSMSMHISSDGHRGILFGDALTHPAQLAEPNWGFLWDMDPELARRSRHEVVDKLDTDGMAIGAGHFGLGRLVRKANRRIWIAV